jgi:hypothetical protein
MSSLTDLTMKDLMEADFATQHAALAALVKALKPAKGGRRKAPAEDGAPKAAPNDYMLLVNQVVLPVLREMAKEAETADEKTQIMSASCRSQIASLWFYTAERNSGFSPLKEMKADDRKAAMDAITEDEIRTAYAEWVEDRPEAHCKADKEARSAASVASKGSSATTKSSRKAPVEDVADLVRKLAEKRLDLEKTTMDNLKRLWSELTGEEKPPSKLTRKKEELYNECLRLQKERASKAESEAEESEEEAEKPAPKPKAKETPKTSAPKAEEKPAPKAAPKPKAPEPAPVSNAAAGGPEEDEEEAEEEETEEILPKEWTGKVKGAPEKTYYRLDLDGKSFLYDHEEPTKFLGELKGSGDKLSLDRKAKDPYAEMNA